MKPYTKTPADASLQGFFLSLRFYRIYAYFTFVTTGTFIRNLTGNLGKQRIILTDTYVSAGMEVRAALANEDIARLADNAVMQLNAETLSFAVATVTCTAHPLLMGEEL